MAVLKLMVDGNNCIGEINCIDVFREYGDKLVKLKIAKSHLEEVISWGCDLESEGVLLKKSRVDFLKSRLLELEYLILIINPKIEGLLFNEERKVKLSNQCTPCPSIDINLGCNGET